MQKNLVPIYAPSSACPTSPWHNVGCVAASCVMPTVIRASRLVLYCLRVFAFINLSILPFLYVCLGFSNFKNCQLVGICILIVHS